MAEPTFVDVTPFAARQFWPEPQTCEVWWEDPRNITRVTLQLAPGQTTEQPRLEYWRSSWPDIRVAKGAVVGAGESGWLANDDWTNGSWQAADCAAQREPDGWSFTFRPLNKKEFPALADFPAVFRRTLKLRVSFAAGGVQLEKLCAYTDSTWREEEVAIEWKSRGGMLEAWDGTLEAFNAEVLGVTPLNSSTRAHGANRWTSAVGGSTTSGILARVRFAANEDPNSFDRAILTLRSKGVAGVLPGVSFFVDDALGSEGVYVRDLGVLVRRPGSAQDFAAYERGWQAHHKPTLYEQIHELPEQTWERSWEKMLKKKSRIYFTLGCEGSRQKIGVEPDGTIILKENYLRKSPGKDTPKLDIHGAELRFHLGFPAADPNDRSILEGCLPVIRTAWAEGDLAYEQEAYATWLWGTQAGKEMPGDDPVVGMLRLSFTNLADTPAQVRLPMRAVLDGHTTEVLRAEDGLVSAAGGSLRFLFDVAGAGVLQPVDGQIVYALRLEPHAAHAVYLKIPHLQLLEPGEMEQLRELSYEAEKEQVADFWRQRIAQGAVIRTPNETLNNFYKTHLMHMLVINDREPGASRNVARCGGFHYGSFPDEGCMAIANLEQRGFAREAERCLEMYVHYQGTVPLPGNFQSKEGVFYGANGYEEAGYNRNQGWVLWCLAEHYRYTRDRGWLERVAPALVKGCDWITSERQATLREKSVQHGFLPSGSLEDVTDYWTWLATNAYAFWGFRAAADVLAEIDHPQAARLGREAEAFGKDLKAGFYETCARSPVIRLRDGRWAPHFPARQERRGRDFGWLREVLEGACHLIYCGLVPPDSLEAQWIIEDFEDNLFLSAGYGYQAPDFETQWFDLGGFSMQSNLLLFPPLYQWRDEPKHFLRGYFNAFTSAFFPDTVQMCEHALPDLEHWRGDHFKSSDEANSNSWLRLMFLAEAGRDLWVGQAIPRAWFEHGKTMEVERAATHFGETSAWFASHTATGSIVVKLDPPKRSLPEHIYLRVRHPQQQPMLEVWVNGKPHRAFDPEREVITLEGSPEALEVRVIYSKPPIEKE